MGNYFRSFFSSLNLFLAASNLLFFSFILFLRLMTMVFIFRSFIWFSQIWFSFFLSSQRSCSFITFSMPFTILIILNICKYSVTDTHTFTNYICFLKCPFSHLLCLLSFSHQGSFLVWPARFYCELIFGFFACMTRLYSGL